jgi:hypothetical protein
MLCTLLSFDNMDVQVVGQKLVSFKIDGGFIFTNVCNAITNQIKHDVVPFSMFVHYVAQ